MHLSTRILLVVVTVAAVAIGGWILLAINGTVTGTLYALAWAVVVLVAARLLFAVGFGVNRFTARRTAGRTARLSPTVEADLADLTDLRDRRVISDDEYDKERARLIQGS
jgi:hypothetical protein